MQYRGDQPLLLLFLLFLLFSFPWWNIAIAIAIPAIPAILMQVFSPGGPFPLFPQTFEENIEILRGRGGEAQIPTGYRMTKP